MQPIHYTTLYLLYFNDFLTIGRFAEYLGISRRHAIRVINKGRVINNDLDSYKVEL